MAYQVKTTPQAETDTNRIFIYILERWGEKTAEEFLDKLTEAKELLASGSVSFRNSELGEGIRKYVFTKQTSLYYRVLKKDKVVEILSLYENRRDTSRLRL